MSISKEELIRKYTIAIKEGNAAIFGGAGLSRPSGYVDWKGLLRPLAKDINLDVEKENDLLSVAQYYRNQRGTRHGINQALLSAFAKHAETNENIRIITRLPIFTYWTTNYDELIENGIREANRNPDVKFDSSQLHIAKPHRDAIVYKMHGDINQPSKAVLTKEDYELFELHRPLFRTALKGDLVSKVFLFIGFSFSDPNLDYVLSQIRSLLGDDVAEHYCFSRRVQEFDYSDSDDYVYARGKQEMQEENLRNYGIQTVFVDSYEEITEILREIESRWKQNNVFISGSISDFYDPWNRIKVEELASKLAGALVRKEFRITTGFGLGLGSSIINGALNVVYSEKFRHTDDYLCIRPFPQNISDPNDRATRWKEYREDMLGETGISIFMFGNKHDYSSDSTVIADGCLQEFEIAKEKGNIIIPIGSTGYAAKHILDIVKKDLDSYSYLRDFIPQLETETDVNRIVSLVINIIDSIVE